MVSTKLMYIIPRAFMFCMATPLAFANNLVIYEVRPSEADPAIVRFNEPNYIVFDAHSGPEADLVVFMPGTDGEPSSVTKLLNVVADLGYRVIGLEYNNSPGVAQVCPQDPLANCSATFREKRIFGEDATGKIDDTRAESIVNRLVTLLMYLHQHDTARQWSRYLVDGEPNWKRIVVSGFSQGAGMAAFIAKQKVVARVVLFSGPWDFQDPAKELASWLSGRSATSPERWFAAYHRREQTANLIARAYMMLGIPSGNIRVFDLAAASDSPDTARNPFHVSTVRTSAYAPKWAFLFGRSH
jgi:hypothetical protein